MATKLVLIYVDITCFEFRVNHEARMPLNRSPFLSGIRMNLSSMLLQKIAQAVTCMRRSQSTRIEIFQATVNLPPGVTHFLQHSNHLILLFEKELAAW